MPYEHFVAAVWIAHDLNGTLPAKDINFKNPK
jgi:hypothetical protein